VAGLFNRECDTNYTETELYNHCKYVKQEAKKRLIALSRYPFVNAPLSCL